MKKRKDFYVGPFMVLLLSFSPILCMEGEEGTKVEWKRPKEPETRQEADQMKIDAEKERAQGQEELEEAEEKGDEQETQEAELKIQKAQYELLEATKAEAKFDQQEGKITGNDASKKINQAQENQKEIEKKIESLTEELASGYQPSLDPTKFTTAVKDFIDYMEEDFSDVDFRAKPISLYLDDLYYYATTQLKENGVPNYKDQRNALVSLRNFLKEKITQNPKIYEDLEENDKITYDQTFKEMNDRINEIIKFQKNPPKKLTENDLAQKLKLSERIPSDQVKALQKELPNIMDNTGSLKEALGIIARYDLDVEFLKNTIENRIQNLAPEKGVDTPEQVKIAEDAKKLFSEIIENQENLQQGGKGFLDTIADYATWAVGVFKKGLGYAATKAPEMAVDTLANTGELLTKQGITYLKYADLMAKTPGLVDATVKISRVLEKEIASVKPIVEILPGAKAREIAQNMARVEKISKQIGQNKEIFYEYSKKISSKGLLVRSLGELLIDIGMYLQNFRKQAEILPENDQLVILDDFDKASLAINKEKEILFNQEKQSKYAKIFKPIVDAARSFSTWIKNLFKESKPKIDLASKNYENARAEYLSALGLRAEENPSAKEIKEALRKTIQEADKTKESAAKEAAFIKASENFAKRSAELTGIYSKMLDQIESVKLNFQWLVAGWDAVGMEKPKNVIDIVNNVVDLRDLRIAFLEAARNGVELMKEDLKPTLIARETGYEEMVDVLVDKLSRMVSNEMAKTIKDYSKALDEIDKSITKERENIKKMQKQQQGVPPS